MNNMDKQTIKRLQKLLIGNKCRKFVFKGSAIIISLEKRTLTILSKLRISDSNRIILTNFEVSNLDETRNKEFTSLFKGKIISNVTVSGRCHDICLDFENDITIDTFSDSNKYESWQLVGGPQEMIIAGPGTSWSEF